ncbi:MAG TPA: thioredoxin family protein [Terriglobia bacterium]|nr:thioredoxin family protein [Terriglobia bacterium]
MKRFPSVLWLTSILLLMLPVAWAIQVGSPAPDFTATDTFGKVHHLSDYKGKFVVLEWHNRDCPWTGKHYYSGNMQRLQKEWTQKGVVWFTVISSAPDAEGYVTAEDENGFVSKMDASPTAVLLDPKGDLGHLFGAKTTPHMFVIDKEGVLIYNGAIDDKPTPHSADIAPAKNYVQAALEEAMAGRPVSIPTTRPYGCSIKYAGTGGVWPK